MVAEHSGACSPDILGTFSPPVAMAAASTPGGPYVQPGIMNEQFVEVTVQGAFLKIGLAGAVSLLGASVIGESIDVIATKLTEYFGKHQSSPGDNSVLAIEGASGIESIEGTIYINENDGGEKKELDNSPNPAKALDFEDCTMQNRRSRSKGTTDD